MLATWHAAATAKGLEWHATIDQHLPIIQVDADQLRRAIGNLLSNAVKYTPAGGTISVSAETRNQAIWIEIADMGIGILPEEQALVFDSFFRSAQHRRFPQGLGLGLTIAREIVVAHGGQIELTSAAGQGSRFAIVLPCEQ